MAAFITNCDLSVCGVSVITDGMRVDVAVRGGRGQKHALGKQLPLSHRLDAPAGAILAASPAAPGYSMPWSSRRRSADRMASRRSFNPAFELPAAAWASLVLARAL